VGQALYYPAPGVPLAVGVTSASREGEREREGSSAASLTRTPLRVALDFPFIEARRESRCTTGGRSYALTCPAVECLSPVYANVAVGGELGRCTCDGVAAGGAPESCRSTAGSAARTLLTSPCCRKGLEGHWRHGARGAPSLPVAGVSQMGRRSCSL
jgi:hypothetical protein